MRFRPQTILTLLFLTVFWVAIIYGWEWPYIAKLMPVYFVAIPGIAFCLVQLRRDVSGLQKEDERGVEMDEVFGGGLDWRTEVIRTVIFFGWFVGAVFATWLLGIVIALVLFVSLYSLVEGRERWWVALILSGGVFVFLSGLFEYVLDIQWPLGILFQSLLSGR